MFQGNHGKRLTEFGRRRLLRCFPFFHRNDLFHVFLHSLAGSKVDRHTGLTTGHNMVIEAVLTGIKAFARN